jgi:hypothetical protein
MRTSASLLVLALGLLAFQVAFSDGAVPRIAPLPIGMAPVAGGLVALAAGLLIGLVAGSARYRSAIFFAVCGTGCVFSGITSIATGGLRPRPALSSNEIAVLVGAGLWLLAIVVGASAIRRAARPD